MAFTGAGTNKPFGNFGAPAATPGGGFPVGVSTPAVGAAATGQHHAPNPCEPARLHCPTH